MGCSQSTPVDERATSQTTTKPEQAKTPAVPAKKPVGVLKNSNKSAPQAEPANTFDPLPPQPGQKTPVDFVLEVTEGKPLNASDVTNLASAQQELRTIRKFAREYLDRVDVVDDPSKEAGDDGAVRGALYDKQDFSSFKKVSYEKSEATRSLIYDAIRSNVLFEYDTPVEMLEIIDVFKPQTFSAGQTVIRQGDEGTEFYVVEKGELGIQVSVKGEGGGRESQLKVGDYSAGSAFGELALIFGSPRAATITATTDCKLWSLERAAYRSVISQLRFEEHNEKRKFISMCVVNDKRFSDIFDGSQIEDLTIATKMDTYEEGEVILREGEMGDTFYVLKSGRVETFRTLSSGKEGHGTLDIKMSFGTTSLLKNIPSPQTYKATSRVEVYYLMKQDYEDILGSFQDALDGNTVARSVVRSESKKTIKTSMSMETKYELKLEELETFNVLGRGAFGQVRLVQSKSTKKVFALKAQSKHYIEKKGQKEHVLNEYRIMKEIENPHILGIHCAMQDAKYLYFLLDLMPGGELMSYLRVHARAGKGFTEDITRFYAATAVLAFEQLHSLMIAYRDLKPENIVLNKDGYGVMVDFGLAKEVDEGQTYTFCGTPDYLAPEIIRGTGHDWAVDYWELGVFVYELTNGKAPFYATNQARRTRKILKGYEFVQVPSTFSSGLADLVASLLVFDQSKRLGRGVNGTQAILSHRWFAGFDWQGFRDGTLVAPIQPRVPDDIKTIGKQLPSNDPFKEATYAPESDWWPDLKHLKDW